MKDVQPHVQVFIAMFCTFQKHVEEQLKRKQEEAQRVALEQEERRRQQYEEDCRRRELQDEPRIKDVPSVHHHPKHAFDDSPPE